MHLLKHIYLCYEEDAMFHNDVMIIKDIDVDNIGYAEDFIKELNGGELSQLAMSGKTLDDVIKDAGGDEAFLLYLTGYAGSYNDGKLSIYCDKKAYLELMIRFLKTILPKLDAKAAFELYSEMGKRRQIDTSNQIQKSRWDKKDKVHKKYFDLDEKKFSQLFAKLKKFDCKADLGGYLSTEFLLANFYASKRSKYNKVLFERIEKFYKRRLVKDIASIKGKMENYVNELKDICGRDDFEFLGDFNVVDSSDTLEYLDIKYGLEKIAKECYDFKIALLEKTHPKFKDLAHDMMEYDYKYLKDYVRDGQLKEAKEILEVEQALLSFGSSIFKDLIKKEKMNRDLMHDILFNDKFDHKKFALK